MPANTTDGSSMTQDRIVLAIDIGGSHVKIRSSAGGDERKVESGKAMTGPNGHRRNRHGERHDL